MTDQPIHVHPTAPLAPRALLPGDPGRALDLAQHLLHEPAMFNHHRGLWGYTGAAKLDGELLTIQSTGMGGPTTAIVVEELCDLGLEVALRVGTCGGFGGDPLGSLIVAGDALTGDGTSRALSGGAERVAADARLTAALSAAAATTPQTVVSHDVFYDRNADANVAAWRAEGAVAVEMEAATIFAIGALRAIRGGCVLVVSDHLGPGGALQRLPDDDIIAAARRMGDVAAAALAALS